MCSSDLFPSHDIPGSSWLLVYFESSSADTLSIASIATSHLSVLMLNSGFTPSPLSWNIIGAPSSIGSFSLAPNAWNASAGACIYRGKIDIVANDIGIRLLDVTTNPASINQLAGYFNGTNFTVGTNTNFHDIAWFIVSNQNYCIVTCQNNGIAIFKINRL